MKVKVKCLLNFRFCLGIDLFFGGTPYVFCIHFSLTRLETKTTGKEGRGGWVSFFFMAGEKKCLSSSCFFSGFYEVRRNSVVWGWWFWAVPGICGRVRFSLVPTPPFCTVHWKEPIALFSVAHILWPGLVEPSRRKLKWLTWAYV